MAKKKYDTDEQAEIAIECIIIKATSLDLGQDQIDNYIEEIEFICNEHKFGKDKEDEYKERGIEKHKLHWQ